MKAAERGDVEKVSSILAKKGINPGKLDVEGRSAWVSLMIVPQREFGEALETGAKFVNCGYQLINWKSFYQKPRYSLSDIKGYWLFSIWKISKLEREC